MKLFIYEWSRYTFRCFFFTPQSHLSSFTLRRTRNCFNLKENINLFRVMAYNSLRLSPSVIAAICWVIFTTHSYSCNILCSSKSTSNSPFLPKCEVLVSSLQQIFEWPSKSEMYMYVSYGYFYSSRKYE